MVCLPGPGVSLAIASQADRKGGVTVSWNKFETVGLAQMPKCSIYIEPGCNYKMYIRELVFNMFSVQGGMLQRSWQDGPSAAQLFSYMPYIPV